MSQVRSADKAAGKMDRYIAGFVVAFIIAMAIFSTVVVLVGITL